MAIIDATKEAITIGADHMFLAHALAQARRELVQIYDEVDKIGDFSDYSNFSFAMAFGQRMWTQEGMIVLVASSLIEAMANLFLCNQSDADMFSIHERATPLEKWVTLPKLFIPSYEFPKDGHLYQTLKTLITRRNAVTHPKPAILKGDDVIHRGNAPKRGKNERQLHLDFCELPKQLTENMKKYSHEASVDMEIMLAFYMK